MNLKLFFTILSAQLSFFILAASAQQDKQLKLWYNKPALDWNEALPVGNGSLGAMIYGNIFNETLQLNESSVWAGRDEDFINPRAKSSLKKVRKLLFEGKYAEAQSLADSNLMGDKKTWSSYQELGNLRLDFKRSNRSVSNYIRELDIEHAIAKTSFDIEGTHFEREVFSSAVAKALFIRLSANKKKQLNLTVGMDRAGNLAKVTTLNENQIYLTEHVNNGVGVILHSIAHVANKGGTLVRHEDKITITDADEVIITLTAATDFNHINPLETVQSRIAESLSADFEQHKTNHIKDYQYYFNRVKLNLGSNNSTYFPTDARLSAFRDGNPDPALLTLYYQYGRYLLISSSRPGGLPANLQGIWAEGLQVPWNGDYHININAQMNYWLAENTNLSEMHQPFLDYLSNLGPDGKKTAKDMYGLSGEVAHFASDIFYYTEPWGKPKWAMWPSGLAWCSQHAWEHYLYTQDKAFLEKQGYEILKQSSIFFLGWLVKNPKTGLLVSGPSISPENTFKTVDGKVATMVMGPTMDHMIVRELFNNTISAAELLKKDPHLVKRLQKALKQLTPTQVGSDGRILEWSEELQEAEPGHRHISHLFGLYPGREVTDKTPETFNAAKKTIDYRLSYGGGHTGWSRAWIINFFARLHDGEKAYENLEQLLKKSTLYNLLDNHPPFQIDGNFGATAGITEMLMQSHTDQINLLPALPSAWKDGEICGIIARGGFELDIIWENRQLKEVTVISKFGLPLRLECHGITVNIQTEKGKTYRFNKDLELLK